ELLTREGEIKIAKRIESGQRQMLLALTEYPDTIAELLRSYQKVQANEARLGDLISGYVDPNEDENASVPMAQAAVVEEEFVEERVEGEGDDEGGESSEAADTGPGPEVARARFEELEKLYKKAMAAVDKNGRNHDKAVKLLKELTDCFMAFKLTQRMTDQL